MTKDDIIKLAREAGLHLATDVNWMPIIDLAYAEKFANLVAEREREACAQWLDFYDGPNCRRAEAIRARGTP